MKISTIMHKGVVTAGVNDTLNSAVRLLKENGIKHLPVVQKNNKLAGIITDRDLKRVSASDATLLEVHELLYLLDRVKLSEVMTKNPMSTGPGASIQKVAKMMAKAHIGCLPVVEGGAIVGIVTHSDLLGYLGSLKTA